MTLLGADITANPCGQAGIIGLILSLAVWLIRRTDGRADTQQKADRRDLIDERTAHGLTRAELAATRADRDEQLARCARLEIENASYRYHIIRLGGTP